LYAHPSELNETLVATARAILDVAHQETGVHICQLPATSDYLREAIAWLQQGCAYA
jgi:hypothetical protein